jgi:hypothetical protein
VANDPGVKMVIKPIVTLVVTLVTPIVTIAKRVANLTPRITKFRRSPSNWTSTRRRKRESVGENATGRRGTKE